MVFVYPENIGKEDSDNFCSMVPKFSYDYLDFPVRKIKMSCYSCPGKNKKIQTHSVSSLFYFFKHKFDYINVKFHIKRHSYLECD